MTSSHLVELQMDTIVGMTHHYGGHAIGNNASIINKGIKSNPMQAALQGLDKMKRVFELGVPQLILPPQQRPHIPTLRSLGFRGDLQKCLNKLFQLRPHLFNKLCSSAFIWTANAATVIPSVDTKNKKVHIRVANLASHFHRSLEADERFDIFNVIFNNDKYFEVSKPLPSSEFTDEGAANHTRLEAGQHIFVHGYQDIEECINNNLPRRQSKLSQELISYQTLNNTEHALFLKQSDEALKLGVFHNDVIATGIDRFYLCHENSYSGGLADLEKLSTWYSKNTGHSLELHVIPNKELGIRELVETYLFNSQWIKDMDGNIHIIAPIQCLTNPRVNRVIERWLESHPNWFIEYIDLNQSMKNGGGPACLRCRLPLTIEELNSIHPGVLYTSKKARAIEKIVHEYYPEQFEMTDVLSSEFREKLNEANRLINKELSLPYFELTHHV